MSESSWPLRIALLLIGVAIVAGVYLWGAVRRRRESQRAHAKSTVRFHPIGHRQHPAPRIDPEPEEEPGGAEDYAAILVKPPERIEELPVITHETAREPMREPPPGGAALPPQPAAGAAKHSKRKVNQLAFSFGEAGDATSGERGRAAAEPVPEPALVALYLRPNRGPALFGPGIVRALNAVGLRYGDMQIFHHYGAGDLKTEEPLFSVANMMEPGHFDLGQIETLQTPGLALFIRFPAALDGPVAFELFLNTAQRLAEALAAELMSDPRTPLDSAAIDRMRRIAARFSHERH